MAKRKSKSGGRSLRDIAHELGYTHGEYTIRRLMSNIKYLERCCGDLKRGVIPEGISARNIPDAWRFVHEESASLMEDERKWAKFFHAELRAMELSSDPDKPPVIQIVKYSDRETEDDDPTAE